jgi:hypothetical protein
LILTSNRVRTSRDRNSPAFQNGNVEVIDDLKRGFAVVPKTVVIDRGAAQPPAHPFKRWLLADLEVKGRQGPLIYPLSGSHSGTFDADPSGCPEKLTTGVDRLGARLNPGKILQVNIRGPSFLELALKNAPNFCRFCSLSTCLLSSFCCAEPDSSKTRGYDSGCVRETKRRRNSGRD